MQNKWAVSDEIRPSKCTFKSKKEGVHRQKNLTDTIKHQQSFQSDFDLFSKFILSCSALCLDLVSAFCRSSTGNGQAGVVVRPAVEGESRSESGSSEEIE